MYLLIFFILIIFFFLIIVVGHSIEKNRWNKGKCKCGNTWELYDEDTNGGRGYYCRQCKRYVWIVYSFVDKKQLLKRKKFKTERRNTWNI